VSYPFLFVKDLVVTNKVVFVRCDMDVPIVDNEIIEDSKILKCLETINYLSKNNAKVVIATHLGEPEAKTSNLSTRIIANYLNSLIKAKVYHVTDVLGLKVNFALRAMNYGEVLVLENLRFYEEEESCDLTFARSLSDGMNIYVNEAFSSSQNSHASILGMPLFIRACAGFSFLKDFINFETTFKLSNRASLVIGGNQRSINKIMMLDDLSRRFNTIIPTGEVLAALLKVSNVHSKISYPSNKEELDIVKNIIKIIKQNKCTLIYPQTVLIMKTGSSKIQTKSLDQLEDDDIIIDIEVEAIERELFDKIKDMQYIVWAASDSKSLSRFKRKSYTEMSKMLGFLKKNYNVKTILSSRETVGFSSDLYDNFSLIAEDENMMLSYIAGRSISGIEILKKLKDY
jgi:phosphoglycerate kinase